MNIELIKEKLLIIEKKIRKDEPLLRIYGRIKLNKKLSLEDVVLLIVNDLVHHKNTIFLDKTIQCLAGKHRSTKDLFNIVRFYRSSTTLEEFIMILIDLVSKEKINTLWCEHINAQTWYSKNSNRDYYIYKLQDLRNARDCNSDLNNLTTLQYMLIYDKIQKK